MLKKIYLLLNKYKTFIRFVIVGFINTFNYYIIYLFFLVIINSPYIISHSLGYLISMVGSFYLNCYFTYKTKPTLKKFLQFPLTYIVNYSVTTFSLFIFVDLLNWGEFFAPLLASIIPIPFTFILSKWILTNKNIRSSTKLENSN
ncbi:GtrA family protein [Ornithinibacillus bavariensis]|uniref:GtrA family protein n=1 Tax=Ornithinibacillus bavariensis TaxID=545502 RepID=UPI003D25448D